MMPALLHVDMASIDQFLVVKKLWLRWGSYFSSISWQILAKNDMEMYFLNPQCNNSSLKRTVIFLFNFSIGGVTINIKLYIQW